MGVRRFTQLTNAFSKKFENHCHPGCRKTFDLGFQDIADFGAWAVGLLRIKTAKGKYEICNYSENHKNQDSPFQPFQPPFVTRA
jgi:hypothetical protein